MGGGSEIPTDKYHTPIVTQPSSSLPQKRQKSKRKQRKEIKVPSPSREIPTEEGVPTTSNDPLPTVSIVDLVTTAGEVVTTADIEVTTAATTPQISKDELTLAQTLIEIRAAKPKAIITVATIVTTVGTRPKVKGIMMQEPSERPTPTPKDSSQKSLQAKDIGKRKMVEPKKPLKRKDQIMIDEEFTKNLEAQLEEEERLATLKEEETNIALIESWDNTQAMMDVDCELVAVLQEEERGELSIEGKSRLFILFNNTMKWIEAFVPMNTELEKGNDKAVEDNEKAKEGSSKRVGSNLEQEDAKRQRFEEENESTDLKRCLEIIHEYDDDVTIEATPLSFKSPTIVDYKIYKEGKKSYFKIIRAEGNSQNYLTFGKMFKNFTREDLEVLWSIIKARFKKTKPIDDMDNLLFQILKTMFEHHVKDNIWKYQQGSVKVLHWKHFDSCRVHYLTTMNMVYYLLVEKMYPFTRNFLHQMWNDVRLQVNYVVEMAYDFLRSIRKQINEGYVPE
uniref:Uncharacterized protein n=1 Tax=Tanacetum cinerariifolium TaxID=118510 RepID=A0A6L2NB93_TANCI|nr:hypothetical protein [Tanacetum cinerariifolium]